MDSPQRALLSRRGSILIFIVVAMALFSVVGVVMVSLFSSSVTGVATANQARRAQYAAESGLRYVVSQIKNASLTDSDCAQACSAGDKECCVRKKLDAMYTDLNYTTPVDYPLGTSPQRFRVQGYPFWFSITGTAATQNTASSIPSTILWDGFPAPPAGGQFSIPAGARLQVGANPPVAVNVANTNSSIAVNSRSITFDLASNVFVPNGQVVNGLLVFRTVASDQTLTKSPLSTLEVNLPTVNLIPPYRGTFIFDGKAYVYDRAQLRTDVNPNTVLLQNIRWAGNPISITIRGSSDIVFVENTRLLATGLYGAGATAVQKTGVEYSDLGGSPDAATSARPPQSNQILTANFSNNDLSSLDLSRSADRVIVQGYIATGGVHMYWAAFQKLGTTYAGPDPEDTSRTIGYHVAPIATNYRNTLKTSYLQYGQLSYDVQVKVGWDLNLAYALQGISFRWHEAPGFPNKYQGYGLSFLRFDAKEGQSADYIPNTVKPGLVGPGNALKNKLLLVLWEQRVDTSGVERKRWLAYAVLGELKAGRCDQSNNTQNPALGTRNPADPDQKVTGCQGWPDGAVNDNATLLVRVEDKFVGSKTRVNEIKVFYGDASANFPGSGQRVADSIATNIERGQYCAEWMTLTCQSGVRFNPARWPSNTFGLDGSTPVFAYWDPLRSGGARAATYYDYFTMGSTTPKTPYATVTWVKNAAAVDVFLLDDAATIRTANYRPSDAFPIPRPGTFTLDSFDDDSNNVVRQEVGLHAMGYLNDSNFTVAFDDLAVQILGVLEQ